MAEVHKKARNAAQGTKGKAKEAAGCATGNDRLKAKGKIDQAKSHVKKAGERCQGPPPVGRQPRCSPTRSPSGSP